MSAAHSWRRGPVSQEMCWCWLTCSSRCVRTPAPKRQHKPVCNLKIKRMTQERRHRNGIMPDNHWPIKATRTQRATEARSKNFCWSCTLKIKKKSCFYGIFLLNLLFVWNFVVCRSSHSIRPHLRRGGTFVGETSRKTVTAIVSRKFREQGWEVTCCGSDQLVAYQNTPKHEDCTNYHWFVSHLPPFMHVSPPACRRPRFISRAWIVQYLSPHPHTMLVCRVFSALSFITKPTDYLCLRMLLKERGWQYFSSPLAVCVARMSRDSFAFFSLVPFAHPLLLFP